jgi:actin
MPHAIFHQNLAGSDLMTWLQTMLNERGKGLTTRGDREIVCDIKAKVGYVAFDFDAGIRKAATTRDVEAFYSRFKKAKMIILSERFRCPELLFKPYWINPQFEAIHDILSDRIELCQQDIREDLYANILLSGGSAMFEGLSARLTREMRHLAPLSMNVEVHAPPEPRSAGWIGGAMLASQDAYSEMALGRNSTTLGVPSSTGSASK